MAIHRLSRAIAAGSSIGLQVKCSPLRLHGIVCFSVVNLVSYSNIQIVLVGSAKQHTKLS